MRWTGPFLIVLTLLSLGCARGDWISETLTLVDVTGSWEGSVRFLGMSGGSLELQTRWDLQQKGGKVTGEAQDSSASAAGFIEGRVDGDVFRFKLNRRGKWTSSVSHGGEVTVILDEMNGRLDGPGCPCTLLLRRVTTEAIKDKKTQ